MASFNIQMNAADIQNIRHALNGLKNIPEKVISRPVNKTLTGVKTDAAQELGKVINAKAGAIKDTFKTKNASVSNLSAWFESAGEPIALIDFKNTRKTNKGVSVQVRKDKPRKIIPHSFIAQMKAGHSGVFWRVDAGYKYPLKTPLVKKPRKGKVMVQRLQIEELYAPRIPDYLGDKGPIMDKVLKKADERLHKNMQHELQYELSQIAGRGMDFTAMRPY